jgi:sec-independent protein translocase protein TatC
LNNSKKKDMSFLNHLEEMRWRIIRSLIVVVAATVVSFFFSRQLLDFLTRPAACLHPTPKIIFLSPIGMFTVRLTTSLAAGIILSLPLILYQLWCFIAPGLLEKERRYLPRVLLYSLLCFLAGAALAYFVVVPMALRFLIGMATPQVQPQFDIGRYISFILKLTIAFGVVFELPVFSYFLTQMGILTPQFLKRKRVYAIVFIFLTAAILTPPDIFSQILMALPLILLYEVSIWISSLVERGKTTP